MHACDDVVRQHLKLTCRSCISSTCNGCSSFSGGDSVMATTSHAAGTPLRFDRSTEQTHCSFPSARVFAGRRLRCASGSLAVAARQCTSCSRGGSSKTGSIPGVSYAASRMKGRTPCKGGGARSGQIGGDGSKPACMITAEMCGTTTSQVQRFHVKNVAAQDCQCALQLAHMPAAHVRVAPAGWMRNRSPWPLLASKRMDLALPSPQLLRTSAIEGGRRGSSRPPVASASALPSSGPEGSDTANYVVGVILTCHYIPGRVDMTGLMASSIVPAPERRCTATAALSALYSSRWSVGCCPSCSRNAYVPHGCSCRWLYCKTVFVCRNPSLPASAGATRPGRRCTAGCTSVAESKRQLPKVLLLMLRSSFSLPVCAMLHTDQLRQPLEQRLPSVGCKTVIGARSYPRRFVSTFVTTSSGMQVAFVPLSYVSVPTHHASEIVQAFKDLRCNPHIDHLRTLLPS